MRHLVRVVRWPGHQTVTNLEEPCLSRFSGIHRPKRGDGWPGIAECIVVNLAHLLPPPMDWTESFLSDTHRFREDESLIIDTYEGRLRDTGSGDGRTVFSLRKRLLGSGRAARRWLAKNGCAPLPPHGC